MISHLLLGNRRDWDQKGLKEYHHYHENGLDHNQLALELN